jgi:hypothetical protein
MIRFYRCFNSTPPNIGGHKQKFTPTYGGCASRSCFCNQRIDNSWKLTDWPVVLYLVVTLLVPFVAILFYFILSIL